MKTQRLHLRTWQDSDLAPFCKLNEDTRVMAHFPKPLTEDETKSVIQRIQTHFETHGFGLWAVTVNDTQEFIGYVGLNIPHFEAHFTPCVEIGWRLSANHWGKGYATEAAQTVLKYAFETLKLNEIVSFTVPKNTRSIRVMEKIGMKRDFNGDFMHPKLPPTHPLAMHILYRISQKRSEH